MCLKISQIGTYADIFDIGYFVFDDFDNVDFFPKNAMFYK